METQPIVAKEERIDDIPLLLGMMRRMKIGEIVDKHLGEHHLHQGLSNGNLLVGWIAYILTKSAHRKSPVQDWANKYQHTLESFFAVPLRPHEFSDDRLGVLAKNLAAADWDAIESDLFHSCFEVYQLPKKVVRLDTSTSCGYHTVEPDGLMQLGHSKDHRPDLPQLKIMAAVTQPLAFPLCTDVVPGNVADDGLYWPTIVKVKEKLGGSGLLFVGDCKMAALDTRGRIAQAEDFYLTPLPNSGGTAKQLGSWIDTAVAKAAQKELTTICQVQDADFVGPPAPIARAYQFTRDLQTKIDEEQFSWSERVLVVQTLAQADSQKDKLEKHLQQAEADLRNLSVPGKGRKVFRQEQELRDAILVIEKEHGVAGLLAVEVSKEVKQSKKYTKPGRPSETDVAEVEEEVRYRISEVHRNEEAIEEKKQRLGWRALVSNGPEEQLSLEGSVLTYREGGALERPFHQMKDAPLGIRPLFVRLKEQLLGLTRLLLIALRVLTLLEIVLRARLAERGEALPGMYEGQSNKQESKPTATRMLKAIAGLNLTLYLLEMGQQQWWYLPPLPSLLVRVLDLLGLSTSLYTNLVNPCPRPPPSSLSPFALAPSS